MYNKIFIKRIEYQGFKNSKDVVKVDLTERTKIYGSNGVGKTTVGEAISWGLLGSNLSGNTRADSTLVNKDSKSMYVKILFNNGEKDIILLRYKGSKTTIYLADGTEDNWNMPIKMLRNSATEISQKDMEIDSDVFMTVFSQEFFPNLDTERAKRIMTSFVPTVSKEVIFEEISEYSRNILNDYDLDFPNKLLSNTKKELKEIDEDLKYNEGAKGTLMQLIREQENNLLQGPNDIELEVLNKRNELNIKLDELKEERLRLKAGLGKPELINSTQLEKEILVLEKEILELNKRLNDRELEGLKDTANIKANITVLNTELARLNELATDSGDCPTCHRPLDKDQLIPLINTTESKLSALQAELSSIEDSNNLLITNHNNTILNSIHEKKNMIIELKRKIENVELENEKINNEFIKKQQESLLELDNAIAEIAEELRGVQEIELKLKDRDNQLRSIEENKVKLDKINAENKMLENNKTNLNILINSIKEFIEKKVELETECINVYFNRVSLVLNKVVKSTGEMKDCFELRYDGKDYKVLSTGEKIRLFVEVSNMVLCLLGIDYPVFLDQAESVSEFESYSSQIIEAYHVKDTEFKVDNSDKYILGFQEKLAS